VENSMKSTRRHGAGAVIELMSAVSTDHQSIASRPCVSS